MHRLFSLYLKACGTAAEAFDTMSALGVTLSQKWAFTAVKGVAKNKMDELANRVRTTGFHATHDNVNWMFRVSHQQTGHNSHFDSGTAATVFIPPEEADYKLPETNEEFLKRAAKRCQDPDNPTRDSGTAHRRGLAHFRAKCSYRSKDACQHTGIQTQHLRAPRWRDL